jgi:hemoglobin-like flavoprotein
MTTRQTELVKWSFGRIAPMAEAAASLFYRRLFELDPSLRSLFKADLHEQGAKLMHMIGLAVGLLDRPFRLIPAIEALGRRHAEYGATQLDYRTVGEALIWTLDECLGEAFTAEVKDAWVAVYELISTVMQRSATATQAHAAVPIPSDNHTNKRDERSGTVLLSAQFSSCVTGDATP